RRGGGESQEAVVKVGGFRFRENNFDDPQNLGGAFTDAEVDFIVGNKTFKGTVLSGRELGLLQQEITVRPPVDVAVGQAQIVVRRPVNVRGLLAPCSTTPTFIRILLASNPIQLVNDRSFVFSALPSTDQVALIDDGLTGDETKNPLTARIPVGDTNPNIHDSPRSVALSPEATVAYVALRGTGKIAVVDALALRQIDVVHDDMDHPETMGIQSIDLGSGARPFWVAAHPSGDYLYVSDEQKGTIYVVDTNPNSSTFYKVIQSIMLDPAPIGLRQIALDVSGRRLYVTAPNRDLIGRQSMSSSKIYVINVDPGDKPQFAGFNTHHWHEKIGEVMPPGGTNFEETVGISATSLPKFMTFTNRGNDSAGLGIIEVRNNNPDNFIAEARTVSLILGKPFDFFGVNNAQGVAVTRDLKYAFVSSFNKFVPEVESHDPNIGGIPGGSNVGIILDPFHLYPDSSALPDGMIAATRPIPFGFADNLVLSPDDKFLYVSFRGNLVNSVFAFDVKALRSAVENPDHAKLLDHIPVDELVASGFGPTGSEPDAIRYAIDVTSH